MRANLLLMVLLLLCTTICAYKYGARTKRYLETVNMDVPNSDALLPIQLNATYISYKAQSLRPYFTNQTRCSELDIALMNCTYNSTCVLGEIYNATCTVSQHYLLQTFGKICSGDVDFVVPYKCAYCYQMQPSMYSCQVAKSCSTGVSLYRTKCFANKHVHCLGSRSFSKNKKCNYSNGKSWSTALVYSIFLGAFGADRFYLGYWGYAVFKLLSLGGLGLWAVVDLLLLIVGILQPADGSVFYK